MILAFKAYISWLFDDYLYSIDNSFSADNIQHLGNIIGKWKDLFSRTLNNQIDKNKVEVICVIEKVIETRPELEIAFKHILEIFIQNGILNKHSIEEWKKLEYSSYRYFVKNQYEIGEEKIDQELHILLTNLI